MDSSEWQQDPDDDDESVISVNQASISVDSPEELPHAEQRDTKHTMSTPFSSRPMDDDRSEDLATIQHATSQKSAHSNHQLENHIFTLTQPSCPPPPPPPRSVRGPIAIVASAVSNDDVQQVDLSDVQTIEPVPASHDSFVPKKTAIHIALPPTNVQHNPPSKATANNGQPAGSLSVSSKKATLTVPQRTNLTTVVPGVPHSLNPSKTTKRIRATSLEPKLSVTDAERVAPSAQQTESQSDLSKPNEPIILKARSQSQPIVSVELDADGQHQKLEPSEDGENHPSSRKRRKVAAATDPAVTTSSASSTNESLSQPIMNGHTRHRPLHHSRRDRIRVIHQSMKHEWYNHNLPVQRPDEELMSLCADDRILFHYGRVILEGRVVSVGPVWSCVHVMRTHLPFVCYPWSRADPKESEHRKRYVKQQECGLIEVHHLHVVLRMPIQPPGIISVARRIVGTDDHFPRWYMSSTIPDFNDFYLNLGDHIEMIVQGGEASEIDDVSGAQPLNPPRKPCPFATRTARVVKEELHDMVRIEYDRTGIASSHPVVDWIFRRSLLCWFRVIRGPIPSIRKRHPFRRATDGPIDPMTGHPETI